MTYPTIPENIFIERNHIGYEHILGTTEEQGEVAQMYQKLLKCREELVLTWGGKGTHSCDMGRFAPYQPHSHPTHPHSPMITNKMPPKG